MRNSLAPKLIVAGAILVVFGYALALLIGTMSRPSASLVIEDGVYKANLALTPKDRSKGWSDRKEVRPDSAIILAFPYSSKWQITTKDMNFPIDILWVSEQKKIVHIAERVEPGDDNGLKLVSAEPALFVIELPAGSVQRHGITVGSLAVFEVNYGDVR